MKRSFCLYLFALAILPAFSLSQPYATGDTLYVVANSGLRLRTSPTTSAGTIRVLQFGDPVIINETFNFDDAHRASVGWLDGHWVRVKAGHTEGFLFDAYLNTLRVPSRVDHLCDAFMHFCAPVQAYVNDLYPEKSGEPGMEDSEDIDQCVTHHVGYITMVTTQGTGWYKVDVEFDGYRLGEVLNLLRSMLVGPDMQQAFEDSLTFYRDKYGDTVRIQGGSDESPVRIEESEPGVINLSVTELITG